MAMIVAALHPWQTRHDPRAPTTTLPPSRLALTPAQRDALYNLRLPDRGGHRPMIGVPVNLPDGRVGGVPHFPLSLWHGAQRAPLPKISQNQALAITQAIKQTLNDKRTREKPSIQLRPGLSALQLAKAPRLRITIRMGTIQELHRSSIPGDLAHLASRGQFSQQRTAPRSVWQKMVTGRMVRQSFGTQVPGANVQGQGRGTIGPAPEPVSHQDIQALNQGAMPLVGSAHDVGVTAVRPAPEPVATTGVGEGI